MSPHRATYFVAIVSVLVDPCNGLLVLVLAVALCARWATSYRRINL